MLIIFQQFFPSIRFDSTYLSYPFSFTNSAESFPFPHSMMKSLSQVQDIVAHVFQPRLFENGLYKVSMQISPHVRLRCSVLFIVRVSLRTYDRQISTCFDPILRPVESSMGYPILEIIINDYYGIVILLLELK